ncbi:MAG: cytidine deaminase [Chlamydiota bacterium]
MSTSLLGASAVQSWSNFKKEGEAQAINTKGFLGDCEYLESKWKGNISQFTLRVYQMLSQWIPAKREKSFLPPIDPQQLIQAAQEARTHAYSPYSNFQVGAAISTSTGQVFTGCNVENAAYGSTICAERSAFVSAISTLNEYQSCVKNRMFTACAVVLRSGGSPCGSCRQMLNEVNPDMTIFMADVDGHYTGKPLRELLPEAFGPNNLS